VKSLAIALLVSAGLAGLVATPAFADGDVCSAIDILAAEGGLKKAEAAEKAGKIKDAYNAATQSNQLIDCAKGGYNRRGGIVERTSKKLGAQAEKAGRFGEAFEYYYKPYSMGRADYPLVDADRAMLMRAKAAPESYKTASEAAAYFDRREGKPHLKEVQALARSVGDKALANEEKNFSMRKDSLDDLRKAGEWLGLSGEAQRARERASQRGGAMFAEDSLKSLERAIAYYGSLTTGTRQKVRGPLGDAYLKKGDKKMAARYYEVAGLNDKASELEEAVDEEKRKVEGKRQEKFKEGQQSLEKELGF
jgi:hypothetical protein